MQWGVHGVGGALGAFLTGAWQRIAINSAGKGWIFDGNSHSDADPVLRRGCYVSCLRHRHIHHFEADRYVIGLRVSAEVEVEGLDINLHGETVHS